MALQQLSPRRTGPQASRRVYGEDGAAPTLWRWWVWVVVLAAVIAASVWLVHWSGMRPSFDPFGWLTWGYQLLHGRIDLNAAPSWKPLPFLFTVPFSLFGRSSVQLWSITSTAGTLLMGVFAFRIVMRLADLGPDSGRWVRTAAVIAALFAALGVLGMEGLPKLTYIANSDQLNTALVLAAIDAHLSRRPRLAYVVLFFAALGRPEVFAFLGLYGIWLFFRVPGTRILVIGIWAATILAWYAPDYFWAKSLNEASRLDLNKATACTNEKILCVGQRWAGLWEWPMQAAALLGVAIGLARRDWRIVGLFAAALLWLVVEIVFAFHGLSAVPRYIMESDAVMITIAGAGIYRLLIGLPDLPLPTRVSAVAGPVVVLGLLIAAVPFVHHRLYRWKDGADHARAEGIVNRNLSRAVAAAGGPAKVVACGQPAALNDHQSQLAWATNVNDADVLFKPAVLERNARLYHERFVLFTQDGQGWTVKTYNPPPGCASVNVTVP